MTKSTLVDIHKRLIFQQFSLKSSGTHHWSKVRAHSSQWRINIHCSRSFCQTNKTRGTTCLSDLKHAIFNRFICLLKFTCHRNRSRLLKLLLTLEFSQIVLTELRSSGSFQITVFPSGLIPKREALAFAQSQLMIRIFRS